MCCTRETNQQLSSVQVHMAKHNVEPMSTEQMHSIAFETQNFSGAQLANLVNLASMFAARDSRDAVQYDDFFKVRCSLRDDSEPSH